GAAASRRTTEFPIPSAHRPSGYKKMLLCCRASLDKPDFVSLRALHHKPPVVRGIPKYERHLSLSSGRVRGRHGEDGPLSHLQCRGQTREPHPPPERHPSTPSGSTRSHRQIEGGTRPDSAAESRSADSHSPVATRPHRDHRLRRSWIHLRAAVAAP